VTVTNLTATHSHTGDGTATAYTVNMPIFAATDIVITQVTIADNSTTALVLATDYDLTIVPGANFTVTPLASIAATETWETIRAIPNTQNTDLTDQNAFPPDSVETQLDKLTLQIQDLLAITDRSISAPISDAAGLSYDVGTVAARAGLHLKWDASGNLTAVALDDSSTLTASTFGQTVMDALTAAAALALHDIYISAIASRPAAPDTGSVHFATDTFATSFYDGAAWNDAIVTSAERPNLLPNGEFLVNQRGGHSVAFTAAAGAYINNGDGTSYLFDQQILLSDGNDIIDVARETTDVPTGFTVSCKATVQTASKKFGYLFPLSNQESGPLLGGSGVASISFYAKSTQLTKVRAVLLSWDSTADAITADVVNAWGASGTNPTYVANWTAENTAADLTISSTWVRHTIGNVAVDTASTANVALFVYYNETDASISDDLFVTGIKINEGATASVYDHRSFNSTFVDCSAFYQKSFNPFTRVNQASGNSNGAAVWVAPSTATLAGNVHVRLSNPFFKASALVLYNVVNSNAQWHNFTTAADAGAATGAFFGSTGHSIEFGAVAVTVSDQLFIHWSAEALVTT
jgi:hypothetical protein